MSLNGDGSEVAPNADRIALLIAQGLLEIVTLGPIGLGHFEGLIIEIGRRNAG